MSVNSKMTALADEIRELSGTTTTKSIDAMTSDIDAANIEIAEQAELLEQIATALEGKASGSGGVTLPTLDNPASAADILSGKEAIDGSGNVLTGTIATKTSSNLTASGATITVPAGYYASNASKSVTTATQATPTVSIDANGKISASATQSAGYVSAGTKTGTKQLTTKAATTITPTTSSQTAVAKNVYTTGAITVGAIPSDYIVTEEITTQDSLISQIQTALQGKASGGSTLQTADVTIQVGGSSTKVANAVVLTNNTMEIKSFNSSKKNDGSYQIIIPNAVIGTFFVINDWSIDNSSVTNASAYMSSPSSDYSLWKVEGN